MINDKNFEELLKKELILNKIEILGKYEKKYPNLYEILTKLIYMKPHEGKYPKMGIVFSDSDLSRYSDEILPIKNENTSLSLRLSDGESSFLWFGSQKHLNGILLFEDLKNNEYNLMKLSEKTNSIIFLYKNKEIKIFAEGNIYTHENRHWKIKNGIKEKIDEVVNLADYKYPEVVIKLIEFAYYELSPNKIGSILIYLLDNDYEKIKELNPPIKFSDYKINFKKKIHHYLVKNFLKQIDGATLILPEGNIWGTGLHLQYSQNSKEIIIEEKGTRHTSAKRFTYDYNNAIVIVTSEDGPITVYSDGVSIPISTSFNTIPKKTILSNKEKDSKRSIKIKSDIATCFHCKKNHRVETIRTSVFDPLKTLYCKVCGTKLYERKARVIDYKIIKG